MKKRFWLVLLICLLQSKLQASPEVLDKAIHYSFDVPIHLEKVINNIETFLELKEKGNYKLPVTGVSMCVLRGNQHEKQMFEDFWIDKVDMVTFQAFQPPNFEEDFTDFFPNMDFVKFFNNFEIIIFKFFF